jgi:hypothetical protein
MYRRRSTLALVIPALLAAGLGAAMAKGGKSMKLSFGERISKEDRRTKFGRFHVVLLDYPEFQFSTVLPKGWKDIDLKHSKVKRIGPDVKVLGLYTPDIHTVMPRIMIYVADKPANVPLQQWVTEHQPGILDSQAGMVNGHWAVHVLAHADREGYTRSYLEELPGNRLIILAGTTTNPADLETLSLVCAATQLQPRQSHDR